MEHAPRTDREQIDELLLTVHNVFQLVLNQRGINAALEGALISIMATNPSPFMLTADILERMRGLERVFEGGSGGQLALDGFRATRRNLMAACRLATALPPGVIGHGGVQSSTH